MPDCICRYHWKRDYESLDWWNTYGTLFGHDNVYCFSFLDLSIMLAIMHFQS